MARLLVPVNNSWFDELSIIAAYYESEFEKTLKAHIEEVFPDYITISYKKKITAENREPKIPDLAMINRDYRDWWIVEVELADHDFFTHVIPQVEVFANAELNAYETTDYIIRKIAEEEKPAVDRNRLLSLIRNENPKVLVIVDEPKPEWEKYLLKYDTKLCVFQVYKDTNGKEAYRINGSYPEIIEFDSHCVFHKSLSNTLEIKNGIVLSDINDEEIKIWYNKKITLWKRLSISSNSILLKAVGMNQLPVNESYVLCRNTQNQLTIKQN